MPLSERPPSISYRAEVGRKALHLLALVVPLGMLALGPEVSRWVMGAGAVVALGCDVLRARIGRFAVFINTVFGGLMRPEERPHVPGPVVFNGATWVLVTAFVLVVVFPLSIAVAAFAAFMVGDAAAALVGRRYGRHRWPGTRRTLEGTAAFALVAFGTLLLFQVDAKAAVVCALVSAGAEVLPGPLNDNFQVPLVGALVLTAMAAMGL